MVMPATKRTYRVLKDSNGILQAENARLQEEITRLQFELQRVRSALVHCRKCGERIRPDEPVKPGGLCEICGSVEIAEEARGSRPSWTEMDRDFKERIEKLVAERRMLARD